MTGLSPNRQVWRDFFFCTDFHQPKWLRMSASGTHYRICTIMVGVFKKRWNSCGTWLVGQCGKAAPDVWLICTCAKSWKILRMLDVWAAVHKEEMNFRNLVSVENLSRPWKRKSSLCEMMKNHFKFLIISALLDLRSSLNLKKELWMIKQNVLNVVQIF